MGNGPVLKASKEKQQTFKKNVQNGSVNLDELIPEFALVRDS